MARTDEFLTVEGTQIHYSAWGDPDGPPVVCVHGLSRVGRDFDPLARRLADEFRVLCPDVPGRGLSEWADDPDDEYTGAALAGTLVGFCEELALDPIRWVGTSMGGALGIALAGGPLADRVSHLVVNDVGPGPAADEDAEEGIDRIIAYLSDPPAFDRLTDLEAYYRETYAPFSEMTDAEWWRFTRTSARRTDDGQFAPDYDPRAVEPVLHGGDGDRWDAWEETPAELFVLRGTDSDVLSAATFEGMQARRPDAETLTVECGHAPALNVPGQVDPIRAFLD